MFWLSFKRILKTGFIDFWRNGVVSLSAIFVMVITLLILTGAIFSSVLLEHTLTSLEQKVDININLLPDAAEATIEKMREDLSTLPQIESVQLLSRDEVLQEFITDNSDEQITLDALELLQDNPFGASLKIKAVDLSQYEAINKFLEDNYEVGTVNSVIDSVNSTKKHEVIEKLSNIIDAGEKFGAIITIIFIILSILITLNTIRLAMYISRDEIRVMNLVGADHSYITGPFIVAGAIYGLVSSILVMILLYPITLYVGKDTAELFFGLDLFEYYLQNFGQILLVIVAAGIFIGSVSSFVAIKRYLKDR
ncbi:MAG TPA: permease-like cell division protein FtsX [Candidatus Paceibacterota bacterium]|nr:permease-like cell division protein FtsX [Candidatus Paceibacterota bacterium]HRZ34667.1 permease-like cell division protein FtsX [Candidatus Paceibacterota bacterium]